jgi:enoyl-CoA hydratase/carnithine racemase
MSRIRYDVVDRVATITIDRPEKRNALRFVDLADFEAAIGRAGADDDVVTVVVTGAGGAFCAGTDLTDLAATPEAERSRRAASGRTASAGDGDGDGGDDHGRATSPSGRVPWSIVACPKPVIAAVDGPAVGLGVELATQCDVRIATTTARFGWVFVRRGLVPDTGAGTLLLPRLIGPSAAMRLLLAGDTIDAAEALRLGFVTAVVEPHELADAVRAEVDRYRDVSPFAVARTKALVYSGMASAIDDHVRSTATALQECFHSDDHREGVAAFLERRPARFTGR